MIFQVFSNLNDAMILSCVLTEVNPKSLPQVERITFLKLTEKLDAQLLRLVFVLVMKKQRWSEVWNIKFWLQSCLKISTVIMNVISEELDFKVQMKVSPRKSTLRYTFKKQKSFTNSRIICLALLNPHPMGVPLNTWQTQG